MTRRLHNNDSDSAPPTTEQDQLRHGDIETLIHPTVAWLMIVVVVAGLCALPLGQAWTEWRSGRPVGATQLFTLGRFPGRDDLRRFEDGLQDQSWAIRRVQPRVQEWLTRWGRFGHKHVTVGRDDWLFYRPGIDTLTGPGFLEEAVLQPATIGPVRRADPVARRRDPRPAILQFHRALQAIGATLILCPVPDKASVQWRQLVGPIARDGIIRNRSITPLFAELGALGVEVFDPVDGLGTQPGESYLRHDTHWTPDAMDRVAERLAEQVRRHLAPEPATAFRRVRESIQAPGDLVEMLRLPEDQRLFVPQTVEIAVVQTADGGRLRSDLRSPVLLMGDSFTNIYSARPMGWGSGAGFAEHVAYHLQRPIDWLARNDAGAFATRELLHGQVAQQPDRLTGKRVVIWEFAERELTLGDWRLLPDET